jgi:hypothetical protein
LNTAEVRSIYRIFEKYLDKKTDKAFFVKTELSKQIVGQSLGYADFSEFEERDTVETKNLIQIWFGIC